MGLRVDSYIYNFLYAVMLNMTLSNKINLFGIRAMWLLSDLLTHFRVNKNLNKGFNSIDTMRFLTIL